MWGVSFGRNPTLLLGLEKADIGRFHFLVVSPGVAERFAQALQTLLHSALGLTPGGVSARKSALSGATPTGGQRVQVGVERVDFCLDTGDGRSGLVGSENHLFAIHVVSGHDAPLGLGMTLSGIARDGARTSPAVQRGLGLLAGDTGQRDPKGRTAARGFQDRNGTAVALHDRVNDGQAKA